MDFESDPAAEFLNREKEILGDVLENEISTAANDEQNNSGPTSDDFVIVNDNDVQENENDDAFVGMQIQKSPIKEMPEKIKLWNEQQVQMLEQKDKQEREAIEELKVSGKKDLDDWYKNHQSSLEKTKSNNRMNDSTSSNDDAAVTNDGEEVWKCVYNLCDFSQQKASTTRDRMKNILLQLNQTPLNKNCA